MQATLPVATSRERTPSQETAESKDDLDTLSPRFSLDMPSPESTRDSEASDDSDDSEARRASIKKIEEANAKKIKKANAKKFSLKVDELLHFCDFTLDQNVVGQKTIDDKRAFFKREYDEQIKQDPEFGKVYIAAFERPKSSLRELMTETKDRKESNPSCFMLPKGKGLSEVGHRTFQTIQHCQYKQESTQRVAIPKYGYKPSAVLWAMAATVVLLPFAIIGAALYQVSKCFPGKPPTPSNLTARSVFLGQSTDTPKIETAPARAY